MQISKVTPQLLTALLLHFSLHAETPRALPKDPLIRKLNSQGALTSHEPYLRPSEVFARLTPASRRGFVKHLVTKVIAGVRISAVAKTFVENSFGFEKNDDNFWNDVANLNQTAINSLVDDILDRPAFKNDPRWLDSFPTVPIERLPLIQEVLFSAGQYAELPRRYEPRPFGLTYPEPRWANITLKENGCPRTKREYVPYQGSSDLFTGMAPVTEAIVDCYADNSESFSQLLNVFSNTINGEPVRAVIRSDGKSKKEFNVDSYESLINALGEMGYTIELFNSRVLVDFMGLSFNDHGTFKSVRAATWFDVPIKSQRVLVPAEHGEINIILRKGDVRYAGARWFFGIPDPKFRGVATFWRPHLYLQAPWAQVINEIAHVYPPGAAQKLLFWLQATAYAMKGFQGVYDVFSPPFNSYGIFICSDSMTFALAKHLALSGEKDPLGRLTNAFPTLYARSLRLEKLKRNVEVDRRFANYADLKETILEQFAVPDQELAKDAAAMQRRIALTFDPKDDERLAPFPDFKSNGLKKIREAE